MFWSPLLKMPPYFVSHLTDLQILILLVLFLATFQTFSPFSHPFLPWLGQDSFLPPFQLCQHTHLCKKWTPFALWTPYWRVCRLHRKQRSNAQTFVIVKKVCFFVNIFPLAVPEENWTRESEWSSTSGLLPSFSSSKRGKSSIVFALHSCTVAQWRNAYNYSSFKFFPKKIYYKSFLLSRWI